MVRRRRHRLPGFLWVAHMKSLTVHAHCGRPILGRMAHRLLGYSSAGLLWMCEVQGR